MARPADILAVALSAGAAEVLARGAAVAGEGPVRTVAAAEEALSLTATAPEAVAAVVLGSGVTDPVAFAQGAARIDPDLGVVLLVEPDERERIERALRFAPFLGEEVTCWSTMELGLLGAELSEAAERTRSRRRHRELLDTLARRSGDGEQVTLGGGVRYLDHLIEHAPIGVLTLDGAGRIAAVNRQAAAMLGADVEGLAGVEFERILPAGERDRLRRRLDAAAREPDRAEVFALGEAKHARRVELRASTYLGAGDQPGTMVILSDVSERVRAEYERDRIATRLRRLLTITDVALAHLDLDDLLSELIERVSQILEVDAAAVLLSEPGRARFVVRAANGAAAGADPGVLPRAEGGFAARVAAGRRALRGNGMDASRSDRVFDPGIRSVLGAPLVVGQHLLGVLEVGSLRDRAFSRDDETLMELVADRAALAIHQARLYEHEHGIAEALQRSLLPDHLPDLPALALAAHYQAGGLGVAVGGDWYDVVSLPDGRVAVSVGDVAGRGLGAASIMGQLRTALRAFVLEGHPPGEAMRRANTVLRASVDRGMATALILVYDPERNAVTIAKAGHLPPLLMHPDAPAAFLDGRSGPPLGIAAQAQFPEYAYDFPPGAALVLYTDGLVERRAESIDDGLTRLRTTVSMGPREPRALCEHVVGRLLSGPGDDDAAIIVFAALPVGEELTLSLPARPPSAGVVRRQLRRWLTRHGVDLNLAREIVTACGEACANVIQHAYPPGGEGALRLNAVNSDGEIEIRISDSGQWRKPRDVGGGRGRMLMEALMDDVSIESTGSGTDVRLRRAVRTRVAR